MYAKPPVHVVPIFLPVLWMTKAEAWSTGVIPSIHDEHSDGRFASKRLAKIFTKKHIV